MPHLKQQIKIILALIIALFVVELSNNLFLNNTPIIKKNAISLNNLFDKGKRMISYFLSKRNSSSLVLKSKINFISPSITPAPTLTTVKFVPTLTPTIIPTLVITKIIPTLITETPLPSPTAVFNNGSCPETSNQFYNSIRAERSSGDMPLNGDPVDNPEINLRLRGFGPVNEGANLISRHGNNYGLDDQMPPQISSLFGGPLPQIIKTYVVYEWDFDNHKSLAPQQASPNFKVHLIGLQAREGQRLVGLKAGRKIDGNGDVFMVLYATKTDITFTHSSSDSLLAGYLFYFLDICVDPNLLAKYEADNAAGRIQLPVVAPGQVFGYASKMDIKVGIRDKMSFVDPRYQEDWWFYGQ
jgi:hypothetical protein